MPLPLFIGWEGQERVSNPPLPHALPRASLLGSGQTGRDLSKGWSSPCSPCSRLVFD